MKEESIQRLLERSHTDDPKKLDEEWEPFWIAEDPERTGLCDLCGQKRLKYLYGLRWRHDAGVAFEPVGSDCVRGANAELGNRLSKLKRTALVDEEAEDSDDEAISEPERPVQRDLSAPQPRPFCVQQSTPDPKPEQESEDAQWYHNAVESLKTSQAQHEAKVAQRLKVRTPNWDDVIAEIERREREYQAKAEQKRREQQEQERQQLAGTETAQQGYEKLKGVLLAAGGGKRPFKEIAEVLDGYPGTFELLIAKGRLDLSTPKPQRFRDSSSRYVMEAVCDRWKADLEEMKAQRKAAA